MATQVSNMQAAGSWWHQLLWSLPSQLHINADGWRGCCRGTHFRLGQAIKHKLLAMHFALLLVT
jgi:hypothetical protein